MGVLCVARGATANCCIHKKKKKKKKMSPLVALSVVILLIGSASAKINFAAGKDKGGEHLPEHVQMMNTPMNTGMMVEESFSGPLAITGGILMLLSLVMAVNYQQAQA